MNYDEYVRPGLTYDEFTKANVERCCGAAWSKDPNDAANWSLNDWMVALAGEVGEAANLLKKLRRGDFTLEEVRPDLARELADVYTYLDLICHKAGIHLPTAVVEKWNEVSVKVGWPKRLKA